MTVSELIAELSKLPAGARVFISTSDQAGGLSPVKGPEVEAYRYDEGDREYFLTAEHIGAKCVVLAPEDYA
jgi:hypothetical protein